MNLLKAMATVAGLTGISRIAGFVRDILTASILGAGPVADAFFVALKLPNFFRRVTAEGAFSVSFVPLYAESLEKEGEEGAASFASNAFSGMVLLLSLFIVLIIALMPFVIYVLAPGFVGDDLRYDLTVLLSRITFPYLLLMSLTALMGGMLNAHDRFAPFAAAPILFNLSLICALLYLTPVMETPGHALAFGILGAGVLQFLLLYYNIRKHKIRLGFKRPVFDVKTKKLLKLMGPGVIGAGVMHINLFADLILASLLATGSISYLYYADRLNQLPLGVVGIAVGTALLPMLSKALSANDQKKGNDLFNRALEYCLLLALPAAVALAVIPEQIISTLFERGAFDAQDTAVTVMALRGYALGLPAYVVAKVLSTAYWARKDTTTPVKISVVATFSNIVLSLCLIWPLGVAGIALSTGVVGWFQFFWLLKGLKKLDVNVSFDKRFKTIVPRIIVSTCIMGVALYSTRLLIDDWFSGSAYEKILALILLVGIGKAFYLAGVFITKAVNINDVKRIILKK